MMAILMLRCSARSSCCRFICRTCSSISTLQTGLLLLPGRTAHGPARPKSRRLVRSHRPAKLVIPGVIIVTAVLWAMTLLGTQSRVEYILAGHIIMSIGFALLFTPLFTV